MRSHHGDEFCTVHGREFMKESPGSFPWCQQCVDDEARADMQSAAAGLREHERGESVTLNQLRADLESQR